MDRRALEEAGHNRVAPEEVIGDVGIEEHGGYAEDGDIGHGIGYLLVPGLDGRSGGHDGRGPTDAGAYGDEGAEPVRKAKKAGEVSGNEKARGDGYDHDGYAPDPDAGSV